MTSIIKAMKPISFFILTFIFIGSCQDDNRQEPQTRLKRKIQLFSPDGNNKVVWDYHYNASGKLDKINSGDWFEEKYFYNSNDQLINKKSYDYANHESGWIIRDSVVYSYTNGKLTEEIRYNRNDENNQRVEYEYEKSILIRKTTYWSEKEFSIINYEYSNGFCIKETRNEGTYDTGFIVHYYSEGKLDFSERYNIRYDGGNNLLQQITYTYNERGDLVLEEAIQIEQELVANLNYTLIYEYEEFYE